MAIDKSRSAEGNELNEHSAISTANITGSLRNAFSLIVGGKRRTVSIIYSANEGIFYFQRQNYAPARAHFCHSDVDEFHLALF